MVNEEIDMDNDFAAGLKIRSEQQYEDLIEKKK